MTGDAARAQADAKPQFTAAEVGALAHLYRGEVYRSTISVSYTHLTLPTSDLV